MSKNPHEVEIVNYLLKPGFIYLPRKPTIISTVVGSSVSVCLFDKRRKIGGMNHFRMPSVSDVNRTTAIYGNVATITLIRMMLQSGTKPGHVEAQIFGGAYNHKLSSRDIGRENIRIARKILSKFRLKIVSEDVGGEKGRKIVFNTAAYEIAVLKVDRLRREDWFPHEPDR